MSQKRHAIQPDVLAGMETSEIIQFVLQHVVKSEEELQEEKEELRKKSTDLKVFITKKEGFELGSIESNLEKLATNDRTHKNKINFINNHKFSEHILNDATSLLEIRTPSYKRTDRAILVDTGDYVRAFSVERRQWTKKTLERIINYLPGLSRLYLSANDIQDIIDSLNEITPTQVSGFTSKYSSYTDSRRISIQFHGGDTDDIKHVREEFKAKPTRVEFKQKNSPVDAVSGALTRNGRINIPGVREGSEELGEKTVDSVATQFEKLDKEHFDVPYTPQAKTTEDGLVIEGFTSVTLSEPETKSRDVATDGGESVSEETRQPEEGKEKSFVDALREDVFETKRRYDFTEWREDEDYLLFDKERNEMFQVGIDDEDLVINARPGTTSITLKDFCQIILEEFNTTYNISGRKINLSNT